jgi:hypothetical protein
MKRFNKILRLIGLVLLLCLATIGISIGGGVPVPFARRKENTAEIKIELVETKDDESQVNQNAGKL